MSANKKILLSILVVVAIAAAIFSYFKVRTNAHSENPYLHKIVLAGNSVHVTMAETPEKREQGLSGITGLAPETGMLFVFPTSGNYGFWMKDMLFSIDILWLANDGTVIYVKEEARPESYPNVFTPEKPTRYVLELPSGYVHEHHIKLGDKAAIY